MKRIQLLKIMFMYLGLVAMGCNSGGESTTEDVDSSDEDSNANGDGDTDGDTDGDGDSDINNDGDINAWDTSNPLVGMTFWVNPNSHAVQEIEKRADEPDSIAALEKIASRSNSTWFGDWVATDRVAEQVSNIVTAADDVSEVPVLTMYAIPNRDCGNYSAGGFESPAAYGEWIAQVAAGIGTYRAIVILEPDALGVIDCLSDTLLAERYEMMRDAVVTLRTAPNAVIYVATVSWIPVDISAERLTLAGVENARGFAINTSDFKFTDSQLTYGESLSDALGGAKFVVDTSRNGLGPADGDLAWCNPPGRALGPPPSTETGSPNADAFLWIKTIGQSDGDCERGEPAPGTWWPEYAIGLAERAAF